MLFIIIFSVVLCSSRATPTGNHTCTGVTKHPVTVRVNVTEPVTFRTYAWCFRVPPRCSKYTVQLVDRVKIHTEMHNRTITVCCKGYVEIDYKCVPACPPQTECPFMHCNRTNHCYCTPGYTGLYCNSPCERGTWGPDCLKVCDCPQGYTCHHLTGDCMLDDRIPTKTRRTTTTEAISTTETTTAVQEKITKPIARRTTTTALPSTSTTTTTTEEPTTTTVKTTVTTKRATKSPTSTTTEEPTTTVARTTRLSTMPSTTQIISTTSKTSTTSTTVAPTEEFTTLKTTAATQKTTSRLVTSTETPIFEQPSTRTHFFDDYTQPTTEIPTTTQKILAVTSGTTTRVTKPIKLESEHSTTTKPTTTTTKQPSTTVQLTTMTEEPTTEMTQTETRKPPTTKITEKPTTERARTVVATSTTGSTEVEFKKERSSTAIPALETTTKLWYSTATSVGTVATTKSLDSYSTSTAGSSVATVPTKLTTAERTTEKMSIDKGKSLWELLETGENLKKPSTRTTEVPSTPKSYETLNRQYNTTQSLLEAIDDILKAINKQEEAPRETPVVPNETEQITETMQMPKQPKYKEKYVKSKHKSKVYDSYTTPYATTVTSETNNLYAEQTDYISQKNKIYKTHTKPVRTTPEMIKSSTTSKEAIDQVQTTSRPSHTWYSHAREKAKIKEAMKIPKATTALDIVEYARPTEPYNRDSNDINLMHTSFTEGRNPKEYQKVKLDVQFPVQTTYTKLKDQGYNSSATLVLGICALMLATLSAVLWMRYRKKNDKKEEMSSGGSIMAFTPQNETISPLIYETVYPLNDLAELSYDRPRQAATSETPVYEQVELKTK